MKHLRWISIALLFVLIVPVLTVFAQDGGDWEWETFTSDDETFSFDYPKDWFVESAGEDIPFPAYAIANTEEAVAGLVADEDVPPAPGEVGLIVMLLPYDFLAMSGAEVPADAGPGELAATLVGFFVTPDSEDETPPDIGEPEEVELTDEVTAGRVHVVEKDGESEFTIYIINEDVIVVTWVGTYTGEFTDDQSQLGLEFAKSVSYIGTGVDLMAALMGGAETPSPVLDGEALVSERCTVCHTRDRIDAKIASGADLAAWTETVDEMIGKGAQLNADERQAVLDYLTSAN